MGEGRLTFGECQVKKISLILSSYGIYRGTSSYRSACTNMLYFLLIFISRSEPISFPVLFWSSPSGSPLIHIAVKLSSALRPGRKFWNPKKGAQQQQEKPHLEHHKVQLQMQTRSNKTILARRAQQGNSRGKGGNGAAFSEIKAQKNHNKSILNSRAHK